MFGFFKKKKSVPTGANEKTHEVLARTASMLEMQLILCKSVENYEESFGGDFVRGYLIGFFDAAIQHAGIPADTDQDFYVLMTLGHTYLFSGDTNKASSFTFDSLSLQGSNEFFEAQRQGGEEYFDFLSGKIRNPHGLLGYFHNPNSANT